MLSMLESNVSCKLEHTLTTSLNVVARVLVLLPILVSVVHLIICPCVSVVETLLDVWTKHVALAKMYVIQDRTGHPCNKGPCSKGKESEKMLRV